MVWSFFLCHRHLWSVLSFFATGICVQSLSSFTAFSAVGIRVRLFVFALLALVSGYQCVGEWGWGVEGKQVGSMDEEPQVRGCYNITFICTPTSQETVSVLEKTQANKTFRT